jgi:hypothetical protein
MLEITAFRLVAGADEEAFLAADGRVQCEFAYRQPGLMRRTTARGADGAWIVIELWRADADADVAAGPRHHDEATGVFLSFVDPTTVRTRRYTTLD